MKKNRITFLFAEICLGLLVVFFVRNIFSDNKPQKRVAVIVENSGDEKWDSFINGLKQAADMKNIHLIICNTDEIENAEEEKNLIYEQLDNQVDAFIVQAAPGDDVSDMLYEIQKQKPVLLVANGVTEKPDEDIAQILPDDYAMGYELGESFLKNHADEASKVSVGIINGTKEMDCTKKRREGLLDALSDSDCKIAFDIYKTYNEDVTTMVEHQVSVDYLFVLETEALEQVGTSYKENPDIQTGLYGIGNSIKCVYYLDDQIVESLVMVDAYNMGYNSVMEISQTLKHRFYTMKNGTVEHKLIQKDDIFKEETQQFLSTYE